MNKKQLLKYWLIAAFSVETFCITYGLKAFPLIPFFTILYFASGIGIALMVLYFPDSTLPGRNAIVLRKQTSFWYPALFVGVLVISVFLLSVYWFDSVSIGIENADMLPVIKIMDQRFVTGNWKHVYDTIPEIWAGTDPIYLPATWLPFSLSEFLHVDMRWISSVCLLFAFGAAYFSNKRYGISSSSVILFITGFVLFWWLMTENEMHGFLSLTEEAVVVAYYVLLTLALLSGNISLIAIAISLCMLSRYSLIGWVPAFVVFLVAKGKIKNAFILTGIGSAMLFGLFILPFGWAAFLKLVQLPGNYIDFAKRVWQDSPEVFTGSMGFAKFFGPGKTALLHHTLILLAFVIPLSFVFYCLRGNKKRQLSNVPLAALKLSLVFFYNLVDVPYLYLFYTSSFVSLVLVAFFVGREVGVTDPGYLRSDIAREL